MNVFLKYLVGQQRQQSDLCVAMSNFKTAKSTPTKMETTKRTTTETTPSIIITPLPTNSAIAAKKTFSKNNRKT